MILKIGVFQNIFIYLISFILIKNCYYITNHNIWCFTFSLVISVRHSFLNLAHCLILRSVCQSGVVEPKVAADHRMMRMIPWLNCYLLGYYSNRTFLRYLGMRRFVVQQSEEANRQLFPYHRKLAIAPTFMVMVLGWALEAALKFELLALIF